MKSLSATIACFLVCIVAFPQVKVINLLTENRKNPVGLDVLPRFSWQLESAQRNVIQTAYEVTVKAADKVIWSSGKMPSAQSVQVAYGGPTLTSGKNYSWQVRVWDGAGKASGWSAMAKWQTALLQPSDWKAKWIATPNLDTIEQPSPLFKKTFATGKKIASATLYVTSRGMYEAYINGVRVGVDYLTPGWTSYSHRIQYQQYDVSNMLVPGNNSVGIMLGNGWYKGYIGFSGQHNYYGKELSTLAQLAITYSDGTTETIPTDDTWKTNSSGIFHSEIYNGETVNHLKEISNWSLASFDDSNWPKAKIVDAPQARLVATYNEPVRKHETFKPVKFITTPKGEKVIDFGQNLTGWVQVKANGKPGDKITLYHAEVLDKAGNFYTENLRPAKQQNVYILKGGSEEIFEPHFTFQGFRYIKVEGFPGDLKSENFTAIALYSDLAPTGNFECSNTLINQLQHNIQWGQRGNFLDVPTDCPQRDERLGWTGDAQAFSRTATFNFGVDNFFSKWLKDLAADQIDGSVPFVVPNVLGARAAGSAGWADAATIIPWNMYLAYGDKKILEDQFESMKAWVDFIDRNSPGHLWNKGFHFGDWLFYRPFDDNDGRSAVTDKYLIAQCFFAHSAGLVAKAADVLGKHDVAAQYNKLSDEVKAAFVNEYVTPGGRLVSSTQTAYVLALNFDMLPESARAGVAKQLVQNVKSYNTHLTTGFLGTPYLCHVLSRFGYTDVAYELLLQETYPSWLYPVKMGATTIWERWDGIKPDSTFQTPGMNSFNHYAYGAIGDWMYRVMAGIDTDDSQTGYKHSVIKPHLGGNLTYANADLQTYYGKLSSHWNVDHGKVTLAVIVPPNTSADVFIPSNSAQGIQEGGKPLSAQIVVKESESGYIRISIGSGSYSFTVDH